MKRKENKIKRVRKVRKGMPGYYYAALGKGGWGGYTDIVSEVYVPSSDREGFDESKIIKVEDT